MMFTLEYILHYTDTDETGNSSPSQVAFMLFVSQMVSAAQSFSAVQRRLEFFAPHSWNRTVLHLQHLRGQAGEDGLC